MSSVLLAVLVAVAPWAGEASGLNLLVSDEEAKSARSLANGYAKRLAQVGSMIPKDTLREHIRRDFMPRLMSNENDRTAYELGLGIFEKLSMRSNSLLELNGKAVSTQDAHERQNLYKEISQDIQMMSSKIKKSDCPTSQTLQLLADTAKSFSCAVKDTERDVLLKGIEGPKSYSLERALAKHPCAMPFPGSLIMLGQQVNVPENQEIILPKEGSAEALKPHEWMHEHLRRTLWCPDSFREVGFGVDAACDAVSAALDMPRPDELHAERASLLQIKTSVEQGTPSMAAATVGLPAGVLLQQDAVAEEVQTMTIQQQLAANMKRLQQLEKKKLTLAQKKDRLKK